MIRNLLHKYLLEAVLLALIALILYGVFSATSLATILILFVVLRWISLGAEAMRSPVPAAQWETMSGALAKNYESLTVERRAAKAVDLDLDPRLSALELAQQVVNRAVRNYAPPRPKRELSAEALGVVAFAILIPLDIALYTRQIFSLRSGQGWEGAVLAVLCVGLYAWPHRWLKSPDHSRFRISWWAIPFALALFFLNRGIETRHPYLNPINPERHRLAAERVLSLKNNVTAGHYADWVLRYARELDEQGESQNAIYFYRAALRLDANNRAAYARLTALESQSSGNLAVNPGTPVVSPSAPYWTTENPVIKLPRLRIDKQLEDVDGCTIVIVPVGEVPAELLDAVGYVIHRELDLPVFVSTDAVPLPPHTRVPGLAIGPQWDEASLVQVFTNTIKSFPRAPVKYVLITPVDIYIQDANYVFSTTYDWGAVVSSARFGEARNDDNRFRHRTAKQALGALLKSFNVPASTDRNDVTSYTRSLEEFDAKGNRPDSETLEVLRRTVSDMNSTWRKRKPNQ
jgi:predicted Zn-dependent protease